ARPSGEISPRGCVALPFHPTVAISLSDRSQLHRHGAPGMTVTIRSRKGEANMRTIGISLPRALRLTTGGLREICARGEALRGSCPKGAQIGTGYGRTPLLDKPLRGPIFVVQPPGSEQPEIWIELKQGNFELNLRSRSSTRDRRATTVVQNMP